MRVSVAEPAWMNPHFRACPEAGASRTGRLQPALLALAPGKRIAFTGSGCGAVSGAAFGADAVIYAAMPTRG